MSLRTVPASGLLSPSPSPSVTELDKAGDDSNAFQSESNDVARTINGSTKTVDDHTPIVSAEGNEEAGSEKAMVPIETQQKDGEKVINSIEAEDDTKIDVKEDLENELGSDGTSSGTDSGSMGVTNAARRRKYLRGYNAYVMSLEERITKLETQIETNPPTAAAPKSRRSSTSSSTSLVHIDLVEIRATIPELKLMTWDEYLVQKGCIIPEKAHAIDVLIDEPILFHQRTRKKHHHDGVPSAQVKEAAPTAARRCEGLPSRIRINSEMILHSLWKITKKRFVLGKPSHPRILLRPYKLLYLFENDLRELLTDLEAKFKERQADSPTKAKETAQESESNKQTSTAVGSADEDDVAGEERREVEGLVAKQALANNARHTQEGFGDAREDEPHTIGKTARKDSLEYYARGPQGRGYRDLHERSFARSGPSFDERYNGEEGISDLKCLIKFIDDYLRPIQTEYDTCQREKVRFSELYHLLKPDQLAYVTEKNCPQHIWRVVQVTGGRPYLSPYVAPPPGLPASSGTAVPLYDTPQGVPSQKPIAAGYDEISPFVIDCEYIDYNGVRFGPIFRKFHIDPFQDEIDIKSLSVVPFKYAKKYWLLNEEELAERGKKFLEFTEASHRYYSGRTLTRTPLGLNLLIPASELYDRGGQLIQVSEETVESEVIVDFDRTFNSNPNWSPRLGEDIIFEMMDGREAREPDYEDGFEEIDYDMEWDRQMRNDIMAIINVQTQKYFTKDEVPQENDLLLLPSRVFAFILRSRKWAALDIDNLRPIKARQNGFDDLELPTGHKDVVQALVQTHFRRTKKKGLSPSDEEDEEQFDLVRDKGKGLIILLHGAPGVGKTSTAECVAESNNVPLLPITCGDLGITAQDVERKLEMNFRLAQAWGCVLLLDEADVFLAQRSSADLERNAVVSVFLRVLEYYEGILFLTTNRVGAFDEAFKSRIHLSLFYPWLNAVQTIKIWDMHMRRIQERINNIVVDREQILAYASLHFDSQCRMTGGTGWNGRQIRNAFQSATALAQFEAKAGTPAHLEVKHFEIVAKAAAEFDDYLIRTTGHSDAERAAFNMIRTDTFNPNPRNPMSLESLMQARGYGGGGAAHMAFGGGIGSGAAQAAFGGQGQGTYGTGQQGMQSMNQGSYGMTMPQGMPFQQPGYGMQGPTSAQSAFMGGTSQMGSQGQMWPMQNQGQVGLTTLQQGGMGQLSREISQVQDSGIGQNQGQAQGQQGQGQGQVTSLGQGQGQGGVHIPQGYSAAQGFGQFPQGGQAFQR